MVKINEIETKKPYKESMKQKAGSFKNINKIDKPKSLANLTKMKKEKIQIHKTRNKKEEIITINKEIQGIIRDYFENLYSNKLENLEEMDKFLDVSFQNRSITCNEI
jgi:hypothetical protein